MDVGEQCVDRRALAADGGRDQLADQGDEPPAPSTGTRSIPPPAPARPAEPSPGASPAGPPGPP
ncbi:hypothetical protein ACFQ0M_21055 [Kitasatospora aburaviensis]